MPLRRHFQQLADRHGAEALSRPDIDVLLAAEGAFDALPALRFITRAAALEGVFDALARSGGQEDSRRVRDRFLARTGFRPDMAESVLDAALAALGKPSAPPAWTPALPYGTDPSPAAEAAEPLIPYGEIAMDRQAAPDALSRVTAAIEIRRDNEARRGARIGNPACVLADRDSMTITFELTRTRSGTGLPAVARYAVYDTAGRIADTDYAGDITPGDTSPLPVKRTIPVSPATAARVVLFLD